MGCRREFVQKGPICTFLGRNIGKMCDLGRSAHILTIMTEICAETVILHIYWERLPVVQGSLFRIVISSDSGFSYFFLHSIIDFVCIYSFVIQLFPRDGYKTEILASTVREKQGLNYKTLI